jgi:acetoin utilization protein AcuB
MQDRKDKWTVGQWMTPNPEYVSPSTSVRNAFMQMRHGGFRHLLVVDNDRLVGIVTDRDLRRPDVSKEADGWNEFYNIDDDCEVRFVMSTDVKSVTPGDSLEKAGKFFLEHRFGALPVLDREGKPIGILTTHDMMKAFDVALKMVGDVLRRKDISTY